MIRICYNSSCNWRYEYQPPKCTVVVCNESESEFHRSNRVWQIGDAYIDEDDCYKHLRIHCNKYLSLDENMKSATIKLKSTLLSLGNCGVHEEGLNPITSKHIYKTIVLPKALYGCEIWDNLSIKHLDMLEMAHRFCVKYLQSLPKRTNTDLALSLINLQNIEHEIDYRKLMFLRQLCCLPLDYTAKEIFLYRLVNFNGRISSQRGFIPDIHRILEKYSLTHVLHTFAEIGTFISKTSWKRLVGDKIREIYETERACRVLSSVSNARIVNINDANKEYIMWYVCKQFPQYLPLAQTAVRMLARMFSGKWLHTCYLCGDFILSQSEYLMLYCIKLNQNRETLWYKLICRFDIDYFKVFISNSPESQIDLLFSGSRGI